MSLLHQVWLVFTRRCFGGGDAVRQVESGWCFVRQSVTCSEWVRTYHGNRWSARHYTAYIDSSMSRQGWVLHQQVSWNLVATGKRSRIFSDSAVCLNIYPIEPLWGPVGVHEVVGQTRKLLGNQKFPLVSFGFKRIIHRFLTSSLSPPPFFQMCYSVLSCSVV
jgi:hypothetical protein